MSRNRLNRLRPRVKIWLEAAGRPAFGDGKLTWLEAIAETGSLRKAARRLGMSYRGLWHRLRVMETRLGVALADRRTGGAGGGGMALTPAARTLVARYRRFRAGIDAFVQRRFDRLFLP